MFLHTNRDRFNDRDDRMAIKNRALPRGKTPSRHDIPFSTSSGSGAIFSDALAPTIASFLMRYTPAMPKAAKDGSSRRRGKPNGGSVKYKSPRLEKTKSLGLFKWCPCRRQLIFVKEREQCLALFRKGACTSTTGYIYIFFFHVQVSHQDSRNVIDSIYDHAAIAPRASTRTKKSTVRAT